MNPLLKTSPLVDTASDILQLRQQLARKDQALFAAEAIIQELREALRLERIKRFGKQSEKLSDLQLELLSGEPALSSEEIAGEVERGPLPDAPANDEESKSSATKQQNARRNHPGRNDLPSHLKRVEKIIACAPEQCTCGRCGKETKVIGYERTELLSMKPVEYFVTVLMREKRACATCKEEGVATATVPARIAPKSIFADETIIEFIIRKYADSLPLFRQQAILRRDAGIDVALSTINDAVLRTGELLIPIVGAMKRDLLTGGYIQADETYCGVQTPDKKGENHRAWFWQYSAPAKGVIFDFEMTRAREVPREFFKDYGGILHTDGYAAYEKDVGTKDVMRACCWAHARRRFIDALKVQTKSHAADRGLERTVVLMDELFAIDREAREQNLSLDDRHALRQERAPALLAELHALLLKMKASRAYLKKSIAGQAIDYTLKRWEKLTCFLAHPVIELSTNWAENSMRPIALGRRNWLQIGSKEAGLKIAAIFSIIESCRKLGVPIRQYMADVLPGLADRSIQSLPALTPAAYEANLAK
ncbi:IS66 family transposase [Telmatobacter bradus]|uniref:IS66 family transposase n=1 Tax=Telmatobacter bradus TaxID=474953 RepID=UPI003B43B9D5